MRALLITSTVSVALALAGVAGSATTARTPTLRLDARTVHGRAFSPRETVRVTFNGAFHATRTVRTTSLGTFATDLPRPYDPCDAPLIVSAAGTHGDTAVLKLPPRMCPPA